jgi:serine phosphatase RsbU (regulator of sigma subunit)
VGNPDGITEARGPDGAQFGLDRLIELAERHSVSGLPGPEVLRRPSHAVLDHQHGQRHDDATLTIVKWRPLAGLRIVP